MQGRILKIGFLTLIVGMLLVLYGGEAPAVHETASATISASPTRGPAPLTVNFIGSGSPPSDEGCPTETYTWSFGDGSPEASGQSVVHTYTQPGTYIAQLKYEMWAIHGIDPTTCLKGKDTPAVTIRVTQLQPLVADINANPRSGPAPLTVVFDSSGSKTDPGCTINLYSWDFGDGTTQTGGATATHTYNTAGTYSARLTIWDNCDRSDSDTITIDVFLAQGGTFNLTVEVMDVHPGGGVPQQVYGRNIISIEVTDASGNIHRSSEVPAYFQDLPAGLTVVKIPSIIGEPCVRLENRCHSFTQWREGTTILATGIEHVKIELNRDMTVTAVFTILPQTVHFRAIWERGSGKPDVELSRVPITYSASSPIMTLDSKETPFDIVVDNFADVYGKAQPTWRGFVREDPSGPLKHRTLQFKDWRLFQGVIVPGEPGKTDFFTTIRQEATFTAVYQSPPPSPFGPLVAVPTGPSPPPPAACIRFLFKWIGLRPVKQDEWGGDEVYGKGSYGIYTGTTSPKPIKVTKFKTNTIEFSASTIYLSPVRFTQGNTFIAALCRRDEWFFTSIGLWEADWLTSDDFIGIGDSGFSYEELVNMSPGSRRGGIKRIERPGYRYELYWEFQRLP